MNSFFFGREEQTLYFVSGKIKPVYVVSTRGHLFVCRGKKGKTYCILEQLVMVRFHCENYTPWAL